MIDARQCESVNNPSGIENMQEKYVTWCAILAAIVPSMPSSFLAAPNASPDTTKSERLTILTMSLIRRKIAALQTRIEELMDSLNCVEWHDDDTRDITKQATEVLMRLRSAFSEDGKRLRSMQVQLRLLIAARDAEKSRPERAVTQFSKRISMIYKYLRFFNVNLDEEERELGRAYEVLIGNSMNDSAAAMRRALLAVRVAEETATTLAIVLDSVASAVGEI